MARPATIFPVTTGRDRDRSIPIGRLLRCLGWPNSTAPRLYIYDGETVREHVNTLKRLLELNYPALSEIAYAAKAYFSLGFARKLAGMGLGVDVVSLGELARGGQGRLQTGKNPSARE